jgi:uncharacterized protein YgbK (DUF1537 family)
MLLLGCIADDFTGGTDIALTLVRGGMRTVQVIGVPPAGGALPEADAVVVSLKSRTSPVADAVAESVAGADALLAAGARQLVFKYCSTFDSTDAGNIGPVAEALLERVGGGITLACPAFPENGRTVYQGHLFVGTALLSESPLKNHPLTPMRDPDLVRVLQRQTRLPVGLVPYGVVEKGPEAIATAFDKARTAGQRIVIVDALSDRHLRDVATAAADLPLITGGSGIAIGLPDNFRRRGLLTTTDATAAFSAPPGRAAILAGSCSQATLGQIAVAKEAGLPALAVDALDLCAGTVTVADIVQWAAEQSSEQPLLIYSSADPEVIKRVQERMGREQAGAAVEKTFAAVARELLSTGVTRMIVAGGETSGAVVGALGVSALEIGPEIDPGVPWTRALGGPNLALALKSGNFGAPDFFLEAWERLA